MTNPQPTFSEQENATGMTTFEKADGAEFLGTNESGNVGAIYTEEKDRVRKRGDGSIYNYNMNIMARQFTFRRWPFRGRDPRLGNFLCS
jgi:hypothetical protein